MSIESFENFDIKLLIIFGAAVYFLAVMIYSYIYYRKVQKWPYVVGQLRYAYVDHISKNSDGTAYEKVSYEYEVDGRQFIGKRLSPFFIRGKVAPLIKKQLDKIQYVSEGQVKVFYDPGNPSKSYLIKTIW
ncbi:DUF3592 domain-containing protein [Alcanivorax sp.]|uniref:DUF3592 domain-containing protein n=1 Tax=Alcanivorax sp. TaxID=1872427 RepID=UPI0025C5F5BE|nr:DUF3592 domain-containing protein [Alcanivorax sp.]